MTTEDVVRWICIGVLWAFIVALLLYAIIRINRRRPPE
jgi:hypothetical protein